VGVASSDADVVEASGVADGEFAVAVDGVVSEAVAVDRVGWWVGVGFGSRGVGLEGRASVEGPVRPDGVVVVDEAVELALQGLDAAGGSLFGEEPLEGLVEAFDAPMFVKRREWPATPVVSGEARRTLPGRCSASGSG
jgi:hypothetical protein